jgi:hypothetical protein
MRTQKGGGPEMNLARNWARWGSSTSPKVGAVVVWPHHVGMITGKARTANGSCAQAMMADEYASGRGRWRAPCFASKTT